MSRVRSVEIPEPTCSVKKAAAAGVMRLDTSDDGCGGRSASCSGQDVVVPYIRAKQSTRIGEFQHHKQVAEWTQALGIPAYLYQVGASGRAPQTCARRARTAPA